MTNKGKYITVLIILDSAKNKIEGKKRRHNRVLENRFLIVHFINTIDKKDPVRTM